jgi:hypothetical protein
VVEMVAAVQDIRVVLVVLVAVEEEMLNTIFSCSTFTKSKYNFRWTRHTRTR